jgi:hypothetical protein
VLWEVLYNPAAGGIARCAHVVVSFYTAGAVLLSRKSAGSLEAALFFDPNAMEGEWGREHKGSMIGYTSCLTAAIAREFILNPASPNIPAAIQSGIRAMRYLHVIGYGLADGRPEQVKLSFPASEIAAKLSDQGDCLAVAQIRNPAQDACLEARPGERDGTAHFWTILEERNPHSLESIAERVAIGGLEHALPDVPVGRFGGLTTIDRREIENLRSISSLIGEYCDRRQQEPLSIAVFGPPGAGKSFAVTEVARSAREGEIIDMTFNLSQLTGVDALFDAFHQVRDVALSGKMPLVFWDEFDSPLDGSPLGWLKYFLVPMQDGKFQEGQVIHPIGKSVFVFAGGTSHSMEAFGQGLDEEQLRVVKLPDFVSRLKGFLNILGQDRRVSNSEAGEAGDPSYVIRRAILLRSILLGDRSLRLVHNEDGKKTLSIDRGVLRAFLLTRAYKHGARSMKAIVAMSRLAGRANFERSSLPSESQLDLHVDGCDFLALVQGAPVAVDPVRSDEDLLEKLAEAAHQTFCDELKAQGYKYGLATDRKRKTHSSLKPYGELPEEEKAQNRNQVRDIPNKLRCAGYGIIPARGDVTPAEFSAEEVELLAKKEHERWMKQKLDNGWRHAPKTNKEMKTHKCLLPWDKLPRYEQDKDRALMRGIPTILAKAGYTMTKQAK